MAYDGRALARAGQILHDRAQAHENELNARAEKLTALCPELGVIGTQLRRTVLGVISDALSSGADMKEKLRAAQAENRRLRERRASLLLSLGYPSDHLDRAPLCPLCSDSGYTEQGMCPCLQSLYREELAEALHTACGVPPVTLDAFDLSVFSDLRVPGERTTVRESMRYNLHICRRFVENDLSRDSLFFCGQPGTGKTWLAAAAGYSLCEKGVYVVYICAGQFFACCEDDRFRRTEEARAEIRRWEECDVLILDDLGTETNSSLNASALYQLLNTRLAAGKATVLCAGFGVEELSRRYGAQTASRVGGEFKTLYFRGGDLRGRRNANFS